jgi:hypothetical protein
MGRNGLEEKGQEVRMRELGKMEWNGGDETTKGRVRT